MESEMNKAPAIVRHGFAAASLLLLPAFASGARAQSPAPAATAAATQPSSAHAAASSPSSTPVPPFWGRWRAERRAARQVQEFSSPTGTGSSSDSSGVYPVQGQSRPALQRFIESLPPAERESFQRNLKRWRELTPQEREALRGQAGQHHARMLEEAERALQESGLKLNNDGREIFLLRYSQERRKLERELREKMETERAHRLPAITEALKREFAMQNSSSPVPTASSSAAR
jgi:hypothetical protein